MKTQSPVPIALKLVLLYVCVLIAGTVACSGIYTIYQLCTDLVAGQGAPSFDLTHFLNGVFIFTPVVLIAGGVLMCLYLIRNTSSSWLPLIVYSVIYVASWLFLMPLNFGFYGRISSAAPAAQAGATLSPGYFRHEADDLLFYYSAVDARNVASGTCIVPEATGQNVYTFSGMQISSREGGFSDNIIRDTVEMPWAVGMMVRTFRQLIRIAGESFRGGFLAWACFATISLSLFSVVGVRHASRWRLVNVLMIVCLTVGIVIFNIFAYKESSFLLPVRGAVNAMLPFIPLPNPFIALFNVVVFLVLSVLGLFIDIGRKSRASADDDFEEGLE